MTYSEKLKDPRWQKKRLQILERDGWACRQCGIETETLHIHHMVYMGEPWEAPDHLLVTLCEDCHVTFDEAWADAIKALSLVLRDNTWLPEDISIAVSTIRQNPDILFQLKKDVYTA